MKVDLWGRHLFKFIHKPAAGKSGGILVAWNSSIVELSNFRIGDFSVSHSMQQ